MLEYQYKKYIDIQSQTYVMNIQKNRVPVYTLGNKFSLEYEYLYDLQKIIIGDDN